MRSCSERLGNKTSRKSGRLNKDRRAPVKMTAVFPDVNELDDRNSDRMKLSIESCLTRLRTHDAA
jgi:hypothetical protein